MSVDITIQETVNEVDVTVVQNVITVNVTRTTGSGGVTSVNGDTGDVVLTTDNVDEGSINLYFTAARVRATVLTGISFASGIAITATDTILSAFGKLQKQISSLGTVAFSNNYNDLDNKPTIPTPQNLTQVLTQGNTSNLSIELSNGTNLTILEPATVLVQDTATTAGVNLSPAGLGIFTQEEGLGVEIKTDDISEQYTAQFPNKIGGADEIIVMQTDLISSDIGNAIVLGTDNKPFVPAGTGGGGVESVTGANVDNTDPLNPIVNDTPINASGGGTTIVAGAIEHADGRIKFGSNLVDTEAGLYDVSGDRQIATYSETDDAYYYANGSLIFNAVLGELLLLGESIKNQTQNDARYIQKTTWVDYSATSTVVGWSSFTTKKISYKIIDNAMIIDFNIEGVSSLGTASFTIPFNASSATFVLSAYIINLGSASSNPGRISSANGSNVITVQRDGQNTAFTSSGTKRCSGQITIQL